MATTTINAVKATIADTIRSFVCACFLVGIAALAIHIVYPRLHGGETFQEAFGAWLEGSR